MYVDQTKKNNDIQNTKDSPLSECGATFIAGGPKVNLVNKETGQMHRKRKPIREHEKPQVEAEHTGQKWVLLQGSEILRSLAGEAH